MKGKEHEEEGNANFKIIVWRNPNKQVEGNQ